MAALPGTSSVAGAVKFTSTWAGTEKDNDELNVAEPISSIIWVLEDGRVGFFVKEWGEERGEGGGGGGAVGRCTKHTNLDRRVGESVYHAIPWFKHILLVNTKGLGYSLLPRLRPPTSQILVILPVL